MLGSVKNSQPKDILFRKVEMWNCHHVFGHLTNSGTTSTLQCTVGARFVDNATYHNATSFGVIV